MVARYIAGSIVVILAKVLVYITAPLLALFVTTRNGREYLVKPIYWLQTHDAPLDEYYYGGYYKGKWTERFKSNKYLMRICWLWRNPAYGVAHKLGYDQRGMKLAKHRDEVVLRDTGQPNFSYFTATNSKKQRGFMYFAQLPYSKHRCVELYFGYKLLRKDPDKRCMLVARIKPFKRV